MSATCWALLGCMLVIPQAMVWAWFKVFPDWYVCERCGKVHEIPPR